MIEFIYQLLPIAADTLGLGASININSNLFCYYQEILHYPFSSFTDLDF